MSQGSEYVGERAATSFCEGCTRSLRCAARSSTFCSALHFVVGDLHLRYRCGVRTHVRVASS